MLQVLAALQVERTQPVARMQCQCRLERAHRLCPLLLPVGLEPRAVAGEHRIAVGEARFGAEIQQLMHQHRLALALHHHLVCFPAHISALGSPQGGIAHEQFGAIKLAGRFQPRRQVHAIADHRVIHALGGADIAAHHRIGVQANADSDRLLPPRLAFAVEVPQHLLHGDRRADRLIFVAVARHRQAEHGHHGVADELIEHSAFPLQAIHHQGEVVVEEAHRALGTQHFGDAGEAADIAEQHRGHALHTPKGVGAAAQ